VELDLTGLVLPQRVEAVQRSDDGRTVQFVVAPLERGFGQTLGNTIRRILLSSLRGSAVWAFRMDGVVHEHQTVPGVVEDVHQIIQNLKTLVIQLEDDKEDAVLELRASKSGAVTAASIEKPGSVRILNSEHHLFTLQDDREINMMLHVNRGRGFMTAESHPMPKSSAVDMVRIDSIYNPVLRANFTVDETRVGQRTDYDRLTLLVETNGSIQPEEAVGYAAALARKRSEEQMLGIENFGIKSLEEIRQFLNEHNLHFGMKLEEGEAGDLYLVEREAPAEVSSSTSNGASGEATTAKPDEE
jgi:DNA-directed RNA polymerase subunit alpha